MKRECKITIEDDETGAEDRVITADIADIPALLERILTDIDKRESCDGKLAHKDEQSAEKAAASFERKHGQPLESYKCRHCTFWHTGKPQENVLALATDAIQ